VSDVSWMQLALGPTIEHDTCRVLRSFFKVEEAAGGTVDWGDSKTSFWRQCQEEAMITGQRVEVLLCYALKIERQDVVVLLVSDRYLFANMNFNPHRR